MDTGMTAPKRLYRSRQDRMVGGVAGGLAHYLDLDPVITRLAFVILGFAGVGVLLYVVMLVVVPAQPLDEPEAEITGTLNTSRGRQAAAIALIAIGALLLLGNLGWDHGYLGRFVWPIALVVVGALLLTGRRR